MSSRRCGSRSECSSGSCSRRWSWRRCAENIYALRKLRGFNRIAGTVQSRRGRSCDRVPRWERKRQRAKSGATVSIGRNYHRAEEMLSLAEARRITGSAGEKFEVKHRAGHAVQSSGKRDIAVAKRCRCDDRIILLVIRTAGGVAVVVRRWSVRSATTCSQCDPDSEMAVGAIIVNGVAENSPGGVIASEACDADAVEVIEGDDVAFPRILTPDRTDGGIASGDATALVAQRQGTGNVRTNFVALDHHASRSAADEDSVPTRVDYIARARCTATDRRVE